MSLVQSVSDKGLLAHGVAAVVIAFMVQRHGHLVHALIWLACVYVALGLRYVLYLAYKRAPESMRANRHWSGIVAGSNFLIGAAWGWIVFAFFTHAHVAVDVTLMLALGVAAASAQIISPTRESLAALLVPMLLPFAARLMLLDVEAYAGSLVLVVVLLVLWFSLSHYRSLLAHSIERYEQRSASDAAMILGAETAKDRKSTRLNSSHRT